MDSLAPRAHFPHLEEVVYLNSGSIGLMPLPVQEAAAAFERDIWLRGTTGFDEAAETGVPRGRARRRGAPPDARAATTSRS